MLYVFAGNVVSRFYEQGLIDHTSFAVPLDSANDRGPSMVWMWPRGCAGPF
jgi:hypothetical protein